MKKERQAERVGKVVRFLRTNPLSTSEEIFKATGCGPLTAKGYVRYTRYNGRICWRLNHKKVNEN